jgi:hypothetical protein
MFVLTTRGGELATVFGPCCGNEDCGCARGGVALDSAYPTDTVVVADRDDVTLDDLTAACADFLQRTGWTDPGGGIAEEMAAEAADIADQCPAGTRLRPRFDHTAEEWTYAEA